MKYCRVFFKSIILYRLLASFLHFSILKLDWFQLIHCFVASQQTVGQWRLVFLIAAVIYFISNTVFILFGSSQVQPWAESDHNGDKKYTKIV